MILRITTIFVAVAVHLTPALSQSSVAYWSTERPGPYQTATLRGLDGNGAEVIALGFQGVPTGPLALARSQGGVWIRDGFDHVTFVGNDGSTTTTIQLTTPGAVVAAIAATNDGGLWLAQGNPAALHRIDAAGAVTATVALNAPANRLVTAADGSVWAVFDGTDSVGRFDAQGAVAPPTAVPGASAPLAITGAAADRFGGLYVLIENTALTGAPTAVLRYASDGSLTALRTFFSPELARGLAGDVCGRPLVLTRDVANAVRVHTLDPSSLTSTRVDTIPALQGTAVNGLAVDGRHQRWITASGDPTIRIVDADATLVAIAGTTAQTTDPACKGDRTGAQFVAVIDPLGDADGDVIANRWEVGSGTDPLDAASTPPALQRFGAAFPGSSFTVGFSEPADAGNLYAILASASTSGILPDPGSPCRIIPLGLDPLLLAWLGPWNPFALNASGVVPASGAAWCVVVIPPIPGLAGFTFYMAGITIIPSSLRIATITPPLPVTL